LPEWSRQVFKVLRIALGDFDFAESTALAPFDNIVYWFTWLFLVMLASVIFLNFIIAEVSASYENVNQNIEGLIT